MSFFRNLNDFDVGMRIRKTYSYLKQYVKEKTKKIGNDKYTSMG